MQVVEILAMDEEVQHVVTLATHLQPHLDPVQLRCLEKLGCLEGAEQVPENKMLLSKPAQFDRPVQAVS